MKMRWKCNSLHEYLMNKNQVNEPTIHSAFAQYEYPLWFDKIQYIVQYRTWCCFYFHYVCSCIDCYENAIKVVEKEIKTTSEKEECAMTFCCEWQKCEWIVNSEHGNEFAWQVKWAWINVLYIHINAWTQRPKTTLWKDPMIWHQLC